MFTPALTPATATRRPVGGRRLRSVALAVGILAAAPVAAVAAPVVTVTADAPAQVAQAAPVDGPYCPKGVVVGASCLSWSQWLALQLGRR